MITVLATASVATSAMTIPPPTKPRERTNTVQPSAKMRVVIHLDTEILDPEVARRKANVWLLLYAGNLLRADYPELILEDELLWRYDVLLTAPQHGVLGKIGQIRVKAINGEVLVPESLSDELIANAKTLVARST